MALTCSALDLFSGKVFGWSLQATMTARLATEAFCMAVGHRQAPPGIPHHSDSASHTEIQPSGKKRKDTK